MTNRIRWGELIEESNDAGPYKLVRARSDGHEFTVKIMETYGVQSSAPKGSHLLIIPIDDDLGKAIAFAIPPAKDRVDGHKPGETRFKNHVAGQSYLQDKDGNIIEDASGRKDETLGGDYNLTTDGTIYVNC